MSRFRYEKIEDGNVCLDVTPNQARALEYVLQRAQEDAEFFSSLTGTANRQAVSVLRSTMTQVQTRLTKAQRDLAARPKSA
jgi:ubiquinone biosynthesis protein UbiJ